MGTRNSTSDWHDDQEPPPPILVPYAGLSAAALRGVVDAFVLREGTDYGTLEVTHEAKVAQVMRQLERGEVTIVFDPVTGSVDIVTVRAAPKQAGAS